MSLTKKILISMVCVVFSVSIILGIVVYNLAENVVRSFEEEITTLSAKNSVTLLEETFNSARNVLVQAIKETNMYDIASADCDAEEQINMERKLSESLHDFLGNSSIYGGTTFSFINVYLANGINAVTTEYDTLPFESFSNVCKYLDENEILSDDEYTAMVWLDTASVRGANAVNADCFVCVRFLYDAISMDRIGAIVAGIDVKNLEVLFKGTFPEAMIINSLGEAVVGNKKEVPEDLITALQSIEYGECQIAYSDEIEGRLACCWRIANNYAFFVVPLNKSEFLQHETVIRFLASLIITILVAVLCACIVSVLSAKMLTNGLVKFKKVVQKVSTGDQSARFVPRKHDEIAYLGLQFNQMMDQLQEYYQESQRYQEEKRDLELSLLQAKINPHLLYNTLDIAVWAIRNNDPHRAEELIYALSSFFKHTLAKGREFVALREEITLIQRYIDLQCLASNANYQLKTDIAETLMEYQIPLLLLQPLVENSVIHGFRDFNDDGIVHVVARAINNGSMIEVKIRDDGVGIVPDQVTTINRMLNESLYQDDTKHYGLRNIARRGKNYYGDSFAIEISGETGEYTEIRICIPYHKEDQ